MIHGRDEPHAARKAQPAPPKVAPRRALLRAAVPAAGILDEAWAVPQADPLRAETVRGLAHGLRAELETLASRMPFTVDALIDGALRAADVANLAASSLAGLPEASIPKAVAAAHLAAGAARAMHAVAEPEVANLEGEHADYALKDLRSAQWRARFAIRQTDEFQEAREQQI